MRRAVLMQITIPSLLQKVLLGGAIVFIPIAISIGVGIVDETTPAIYWFATAGMVAVIAIFLWDEITKLRLLWRVLATVVSVGITLFAVRQSDHWVAEKAIKAAWKTMVASAEESKLYAFAHRRSPKADPSAIGNKAETKAHPSNKTPHKGPESTALQAPKMSPEAVMEGKNITIDIGPSLNPKYAFETRFILTNHNSLPITIASYLCEIQNVDVNKVMKIARPITMYFDVIVPTIEDLPSGQSRSLYCDFAMVELFVAQMDPLVVHIWVSYTYNNSGEEEGFRFFAKHKFEDGTYVWFPGGAIEVLKPPANNP